MEWDSILQQGWLCFLEGRAQGRAGRDRDRDRDGRFCEQKTDRLEGLDRIDRHVLRFV